MSGGTTIFGSEKTFQVGRSGGPEATIEISGVDADHNGLPDDYSMEQIKTLVKSMRQSLGLNGFDTTDYSKLYDSLYGTTGGGGGGGVKDLVDQVAEVAAT